MYPDVFRALTRILPNSHLPVSIPVTIVAALVFLAIVWCLFSCCCRRRRAAGVAPSGAYVVPATARRGNRLGRRNRLRSVPTPPPALGQPAAGEWAQTQAPPQQGYNQPASNVHEPAMIYNGAGVGAGGRRMPPPPPGQQAGGWVVSRREAGGT